MTNFGFLQSEWPLLLADAQKAEALVIPDPGTGSRNASPPCQGISGCSATGENEGH